MLNNKIRSIEQQRRRRLRRAKRRLYLRNLRELEQNKLNLDLLFEMPQEETKVQEPVQQQDDVNSAHDETQTDSKNTVDLSIDVKDINKFTKGLDRYSQDSCEKYRKFLKQLDNVIRKIGYSQNLFTLNLDKIVNKKVDLSERSKSILTFIISDTLEDIAAQVTTSARNDNQPVQALEILAEAWPDESDQTRGSSIRQQLLKTKYSAGETIQEYNQKYRALFNEAIRLKRYRDDVNAIDDYLHSFPRNVPTIESAVQVTLSQNFVSLPLAMHFMSKVIRGVKTDGVIVQKKETVMQSREKNPRPKNGSNSNKNRRKLEPLTQNSCTRCGIENCDKRTCAAKGKSCSYCQKPGHLLIACRKLHAKEGNPYPKPKDKVNSVNDNNTGKEFDIQKAISNINFVGTVGRKTPNNFIGNTQEKETAFKIVEEQTGVDTMASCSVLNNKAYFSSWSGTKDLVTFDNTEVKGVPSGVAELFLLNNKNESIRLVLEASYVPNTVNLLSCYDLLESGFVATLDKEDPYLSNSEKSFIIDLKWTGRLLLGCKILPAKQYIASVSFQRWHQRLGHANSAALKHTIGIEVPDHFDCFICRQTNVTKRGIKQSPWTYKLQSELLPFEHIQVDIMYHKDTRFGNKYTLFIIDVKSRLLKTQPLFDLTSKEVMEKMVSTFVQVQKRPMLITTDRGSCFTSEEFTNFLTHNSIHVSYCAPHKHQQNPFAERIIGTIRRKSLSLLNHAKLSSYFLGDAILHAQQLYNITWHSSLKTTPFEAFHGRKLEESFYNRFKVFGSTIFYDKGHFGLFLGLCNQSTPCVAKIFTPEEKLIRRNLADVRLDETLLSRYLLKDLKRLFTSHTNALAIEDLTSVDPDILPDNENIVVTTEPDELDKAIDKELEEAYDELAGVNYIGKTKEYIFRLSENDEPSHIRDIKYTTNPDLWIKASKEELKQLRNFGTFVKVKRTEVPKEEYLIPSRFVYKKKRDGKHKARLVAGGHRQFTTLFGKYNGSPAAGQTILKAYLSVVLFNQYNITSIDFKGADLNADLNKKIYMEFPRDIDEIEPVRSDLHVMKLQRSLYGLKESGRLWYHTIRDHLKKMNFTINRFDPCIFKHEKDDILLLLYVDDCLVASKDTTKVKEFIKRINETFEVKETSLEDFLGFSIRLKEDKIYISAETYIHKTLREIGLSESNPVLTPVATNTKFCEKDDITEEPYREFLGKLLWIVNVRPDVAYATHLLSTVAHRPTTVAWIALKRVYRYLKGSIEKTLVLSKPEEKLYAFCDSSLGDLPKGRSTGSCFIFLGTNLIMHFSRKQNLISTSTFESEMLEVVRSSKNLIYIKGLFEELGLNFNKTTAIFTDAQIVLDNIMTDTLSRKSRHFVTKVNLVKDLILDKHFKVCKIAGTENIADVGTKPLPKDTFGKYQKLLYDQNELLKYLRRCVELIDAKQQQIQQIHESSVNPDRQIGAIMEYNLKYEDDVEEADQPDMLDRSHIMLRQNNYYYQIEKHN